jgi:hypothetical protein
MPAMRFGDGSDVFAQEFCFAHAAGRKKGQGG